jgi:hypothetical protein
MTTLILKLTTDGIVKFYMFISSFYLNVQKTLNLHTIKTSFSSFLILYNFDHSIPSSLIYIL